MGAGQALPGVQLRLTVALLVVPQLLQDLLGRGMGSDTEDTV